jgi:hypothetical protein
MQTNRQIPFDNFRMHLALPIFVAIIGLVTSLGRYSPMLVAVGNLVSDSGTEGMARPVDNALSPPSQRATDALILGAKICETDPDEGVSPRTPSESDKLIWGAAIYETDPDNAGMRVITRYFDSCHLAQMPAVEAPHLLRTTLPQSICVTTQTLNSCNESVS